MMLASGLEAVFLDNRDKLRRFLGAQGAGEDAEDLVQELWIRVSVPGTAPVASPLAYLYRAANNLMLDRYRARRQAVQRERDWSEVTGETVPGRSDAPDGERAMIAQQQAAMANKVLAALGPRAAKIFHRHRVDGLGQRQVAAEFGVSVSTVESDLRRAYAALVTLRRHLDDA